MTDLPRPEGVPDTAFPIKSFLDSESGRILNKLYPALFETIAGPLAPKVIDLNLIGAVDYRMFGLESATADWFAHPANTAVVQSSENSTVKDAATYMLSIPAVVVARRGKGVGLTNNPSLARLNPMVAGYGTVPTAEAVSVLFKDRARITSLLSAAPVESFFDSRGFKSTFNDVPYTYTEIVDGVPVEKNGTRRVETRLHEMMHYKTIVPAADTISICRSFVSSLGLPVATAERPFIVGLFSPRRYSNTSDYPGGLIPVVRNQRYIWLKVYVDGVVHFNTSGPLDAIQAHLNTLNTDILVNNMERYPGVGHYYIGIPTGNHANTFDYAFDIAGEGAGGWSFVFKSGIKNPNPGWGTTNGSGVWGSRYVPGLYESGVESDQASLALGLISEEVFGTVGRTAKILGADKYLMLPLFGVPGNHEYAFDCQFGEFTDTVFYLEDGRMFTVRKINVVTVRACIGIPYSWYESYLSSGFGLRKPLKDAKLTAALSASSDLAGCVITCVSYGQGYAIAGDSVKRMPLYADYARARAKACQANDFMSQKFDENRTWKQVDMEVMRAGNTTDLYGLRYHTRTTADLASSGVTKLLDYRGLTLSGSSVTVEGVVKWTLIATNNGTAPSVDVENVDAVSEAIAGNAVVTSTGLQAIDGKFGDGTYAEALGAAGARVAADQAATGGRGSIDARYDLSWETLARDGYPLYDEMDESQKYTAAVMSVAVYSRYGRPLKQAWLQYNIANVKALLKKL